MARSGDVLPSVDRLRAEPMPTVEPVPEGVERPFWSVMIPTYNDGDYLRRCLESVLAEGVGPDDMQIEVVDDHGTKTDAEALVREVAGDRVAFYRHPQNVGISANFTTCVRRARGQWVHILHADDMVRPGFYDAYGELVARHPDMALVFGRVVAVDGDDGWTGLMGGLGEPQPEGLVPDAAVLLSLGNIILTPSAIAPRSAYEQVGGFHPLLSHTADWEMWVRLAAHGPTGYVHEPLAFYRIHAAADTHRLALTADETRQVARTHELLLDRVPPEQRARVEREGRRNVAAGALGRRHQLHQRGLHAAALNNARCAFALEPSPRNLYRLLRSAATRLRHGEGGAP